VRSAARRRRSWPGVQRPEAPTTNQYPLGDPPGTSLAELPPALYFLACNRRVGDARYLGCEREELLEETCANLGRARAPRGSYDVRRSSGRGAGSKLLSSRRW